MFNSVTLLERDDVAAAQGGTYTTAMRTPSMHVIRSCLQPPSLYACSSALV